jgi:hypothetical protein
MVTRDYLFRFGSLTTRGVVEMSPAGLDVLRALLLKWISEAEKGETAAREMGRVMNNEYTKMQAHYFRSAAGFLTQKLATALGGKLNLREQLDILTRLPADAPYPERWVPYLDHAGQMGTPDEPAIPVGGGGGTGGDGVHERDPLANGFKGSAGAEGTQPSRPAGHPRAGGTKGRAAQRKRPGGP